MKARHVAEMILHQLGGLKFISTTGARLFYGINERCQPYLQCNLPNCLMVKNNINRFIVSYDYAEDLYYLCFSNSCSNQILRKVNQVYADDLLAIFAEETGLKTYNYPPLE